MCSIGNIQDFASPKKLASYFGLVPKVRHSNNNKPITKLTKRGSKMARVCVVTSTWHVIRYNDELRSYYDKKKEIKGGKRAVIATSNKFLGMVFNLWKNDMILDASGKTVAN